MRVILSVYIFICIMLLIFNIVFLVYKNIKRSKLFPKNKKVENNIENILKNYPKKGLSDIDKRNIKLYVEKIKDFVTLISFIEENNLPDDLKIEIRNIILANIDRYSRRNESEKAYYMYALSIFEYDNNTPDRFIKSKIISFLDTKSLYIFFNTMETIYKIPDVDLMIDAIKYIDKSNGIYHKKLFTDGLMGYKGNIDEFKSGVEDIFFDLNVTTQDAIIDFFRMKKIDIKEFGIEILNKDKINLELRYTVMRYFLSNPTDKSREYFINVLQSENIEWTRKMIAIQGLSIYKEKNIYRLIKSYINDPNWYVRTNAVKYISEYNVDKDEIIDILYQKDRYTNEELLYRYKNDEYMTSHIEDILEKINEEDNSKNT